MKPTYILLGLLLTGLAWTPSISWAAGEGREACELWTIHGIFPGLEREKASRLFDLNSKLSFVEGAAVPLEHAQVRGNFKVRLRFVDRRLEWAAFDFPSGFLGLKGPERARAILAALHDRLGHPMNEDYRVQDLPWVDFMLDTSFVFQFDRFVWVNEECNTAIMATTVSANSLLGQAADTVMIVYDLERLLEKQQREYKELVKLGRKYLERGP